MGETLGVVILAAGKGTRMRSQRAKVLHPLCGLPLLAYSLRTARSLNPREIVVVGGEAVQAAFSSWPVTFVDQGEPLGTAHAVICALRAISAPRFLVLPGDAPLVPLSALTQLLDHHRRAKALASFISIEISDPSSYGRVVRHEGRVSRIVEAQDASPTELAIREVNSGVWCLENEPAVWEALRAIQPNNAKGEYYLTDLVALLPGWVEALLWPNAEDLLGVNTRADLARIEAILRSRILRGWMEEGVTVVDPAAVYPGPDVRVGPDTTIFPGTVLLGETEVAQSCLIGPQAYLHSSRIGEGARVWYSVVEEAEVGKGAEIGPFAHLRPGARIGSSARIGNFVEVKASAVGEGAKALHLAYIGDAEVGPGANIGAGAITCNFQPKKKEKFRTEIGAGAFIGTNVSLIAPIRIGEGAVVGAGSVITEDVPPYALAVERSPQVVRRDWAKGAKEETGDEPK